MPHRFVGNSDEVRLEDGAFFIRLGMHVDEVLRESWRSRAKIQLSRSAREMELVDTGLRFTRDAHDRVEFIELSSHAAEFVFMGAKVLGCSQREAREAIRNTLPTGTRLVEEADGLSCPDVRLVLWSSVWGEDDAPVMTAAIHIPKYYDQPPTSTSPAS